MTQEPSSIPSKIASYDAFAIVLLNDEESYKELSLPAELDPILGREHFNKVCFVFSMVKPGESSGEEDFVNTT